MTILVGYASEHGSTRGIAERIAAQLGDQGFRIEVRPVGAIDAVDAFDAVVVGSAIHDGAWLPAGADFVHRHLHALAERPVWLFSVGLVGESSSAFPTVIAARLRAMRPSPKELGDFRKALHAIDHAVFAGAIERPHWSGAGHVAFRAMLGRYGDHRDWSDIDAWTKEIAVGLRTLVHPPSDHETGAGDPAQEMVPPATRAQDAEPEFAPVPAGGRPRSLAGPMEPSRRR